MFTNYINNVKSTGLNLNNTMNIKGIQMGRDEGDGSGRVNFQYTFPTNNVFVFITPERSNQWLLITTHVFRADSRGFDWFTRTGLDWDNYEIFMGEEYTFFSWIAFCI